MWCQCTSPSVGSTHQHLVAKFQLLSLLFLLLLLLLLLLFRSCFCGDAFHVIYFTSLLLADWQMLNCSCVNGFLITLGCCLLFMLCMHEQTEWFCAYRCVCGSRYRYDQCILSYPIHSYAAARDSSRLLFQTPPNSATNSPTQYRRKQVTPSLGLGVRSGAGNTRSTTGSGAGTAGEGDLADGTDTDSIATTPGERGLWKCNCGAMQFVCHLYFEHNTDLKSAILKSPFCRSDTFGDPARNAFQEGLPLENQNQHQNQNDAQTVAQAGGDHGRRGRGGEGDTDGREAAGCRYAGCDPEAGHVG